MRPQHVLRSLVPQRSLSAEPLLLGAQPSSKILNHDVDPSAADASGHLGQVDRHGAVVGPTDGPRSCSCGPRLLRLQSGQVLPEIQEHITEGRKGKGFRETRTTHLVHLDSHEPACRGRALAGHALRATHVAHDVARADVRHGRVGCRQPDTGPLPLLSWSASAVRHLPVTVWHQNLSYLCRPPTAAGTARGRPPSTRTGGPTSSWWWW